MCALVFERVTIVDLLVNVNTFVCGCAKSSISTHYSMELHGPICFVHVFEYGCVHTPT